MAGDLTLRMAGEFTLIYGSADVARELGVAKNVVSNYLARYSDTPEPAYATPEGRLFWSVEGLAAWRAWRESWES